MREPIIPQDQTVESYEAAEAFLEDCMAQVVDSIEEVSLLTGAAFGVILVKLSEIIVS